MMRLLQVSLLFIVATFVGLTSCVEVDYELGYDNMPESTDMAIDRDTLTVRAYTVEVDSLVSDIWTYGAVGSYVDPVWGQVTASTIFQMIPASSSFSSADTLWGVDAVIDSVFLSIYPGSILGDTLYDQIFDLYNVERRLPYHYDSTYYSNFDPTPYISKEPFASIDFKHDEYSYELPISYANQYLDTLGWVYQSDTLFLERFPGIYIKPREAAKSGGLLTRITTDYSSVVIYYHNNNPTGPDTSYMSLSMGQYGANKAINLFEHDLSYANPIVGVNTAYIGEDVENAPITYARSFVSLITKVELLESEIDRIKGIAAEKGYSTVAISNATLVLPVYSPSAGTYDLCPNRLGMYYEYETMTGSDDYWYGITDTDFAFGGYLSRSLGEYRMNITSYVQRRFAGEEFIEDQNIVDIGIGFDEETENVGVFLNSPTADNPMEIELTYVMIK